MPSHETTFHFDPLRPMLTRIAYRMLGSVADAEDIVQEAFVRWMHTDPSAVREPAAFLRRVVMRLCLDHIKSARHQREAYVGPWLPEPWVQSGPDVADVTLPLLLALERLQPTERAAFLLHDVFGLGFDEVAQAIDRSPAACRKLASRARIHVRSARPRFPLDRTRGLQIAEAFFAATRSGDLHALRELLSADVRVHADGGGKTPTTTGVIVGRESVLRLHAALARLFAREPSKLLRYGFICGVPGFVSLEQGRTLQTTALQLTGHTVCGIYVVRNPDKLRHLAEAQH